MDLQRRIALATATAAAGALLAATATEAQAQGRHPHIRAAIDALRAARQELVTGANDFGGHKQAALQAIDGAIAQLRICMNY